MNKLEKNEINTKTIIDAIHARKLPIAKGVNPLQIECTPPIFNMMILISHAANILNNMDSV